jgi:CubicO group peptidase (beta-lactamase class C family)
MTSGLDDAPPLPCDNEDTAASCLLYLADAGTRWSYHTGAYKKLQAIVSTVSGQTYTGYTNSALGSHIGMTGLWYDGVYYSKPRSMARFGLLTLNKGVWANDTVMHDTAYYNAMTNTSQSLNLSYGYLWWLNGKSSVMVPTLQFVFPGPLLSNAPADMFCALGKNDQKIYVVPSQNMVVIRMGDAAYSTSAALTVFDNELWGKIDSLDFCPTGFNDIKQNENVNFYPNPVLSTLTVQLKQSEKAQLRILSVDGREVFTKEIFPGNEKLNLEGLKPGIYTIQIVNSKLNYQSRIIKTE